MGERKGGMNDKQKGPEQIIMGAITACFKADQFFSKTKEEETGSNLWRLDPCSWLWGLTPLEQRKEVEIAPYPCRSTSSDSSGGAGVAAGHHPQRVCTEPETIQQSPTWLRLICTLSVLLTEILLG
ncbi:hypothetical protein GW7_13755 [Heterocephalus glaber]|uniref:Uncharacterized protein n=1 Tax=Heterocephalus glaber TaxID=10181 RepID=G5AMR3_HETGA|nr:hypothetical protein GW7_13755 [Heterocephalus glaber]